MKKVITLMGVIALAVTAFSQEKREPSVKPTAAAEAAFKKAYPSVTQAKWTSEDKDYEVIFKYQKSSISAVYAADGTLKETEEKIDKTSLPAGISDYVKQHYKSGIKTAEKVTKSKGQPIYEIEVEGEELVFDGSGKFVKTEKKDKD